MINCIYEQELQLRFVNFYTKNNCLQYSQRRPVQDLSKSNTIHSRCLLQISGNEFFTSITFIFFLVFFTDEHVQSKQIQVHERWTKKMRLGNCSVERNREVDTSGRVREAHCHSSSPCQVTLTVSEITFKVNYHLTCFSLDLLAIIKY